MTDIFFSYANVDRGRIEPLVLALEEQGWTVWWDTDLVDGTRYRTVIHDELKRARIVVVAWSNLSAQSDWVLDEADDARKASKLIPVRLGSADEVPLGFRGIQTRDFSKWNGDKDAPEFVRLCNAIRARLTVPPGPLPPVAEPVPPPKVTPIDAPPAITAAPVAIDTAEVHDNERGGSKLPKPSNLWQLRRFRWTALPLALAVILAGFGWFVLIDKQPPDQQPPEKQLAEKQPPERPPAGRQPASNGYTIYLHTSRGQQDIEALRKRLAFYGYEFASTDFQADNDSGRASPRSGVDYAAGDSKDRGPAIKAAEITNLVLGTDIKPRPQSGMTPGKLGIWLPYKHDYTIGIHFAGDFDRSRDIMPFAQKLRQAGWQVEEPRPSGGSDRTAAAANLCEVRYVGGDDRPFADLLAADVRETGITSGRVDAQPWPGIGSGKLEIWIGSGACKP